MNILLSEVSSTISVGLLSGPKGIEFECTTGNCTFPSDLESGPSYQTLAIEALCVDVSAEIKPTVMNQIRGMNTSYIPSIDSNSTMLRGGELLLTLSREKPLYLPGYWPNDRQITPLFNFVTLMEMRNCADGGITCAKSQLAVECQLWPTIRTMKSSIENAILKKSIVSSEPLRGLNAGQNWRGANYWMTVSEEVLRNGSWETCSPSTTQTPSNSVSVFNGTLLPWNSSSIVPQEIQWYAADCVWWIDPSSATELRGYLISLFSDQRIQSVYGPNAPEASSGQDWIKALYKLGKANFTTVESYAKQLADSLTIYTRTSHFNSSDASTFARGNANRTDICVHVRWGWIAFPTSLVILANVFLVLTFWKTRESGPWKHHKGSWKSSSLFPLFMGLDERLRQRYGAVGKKSELLQRASELDVSLMRTEDGWRLSQR